MTPSSHLSRENWHVLMAAFGLPENDATYETLIEAYSEKHRHYHSLAHIEACFRHLEAVRESLDNPHEVKLALWFHDVIYKPFSATNEEDSADMARDFLEGQGVAADIVERIYELIILTKDQSKPTSNDGQYMLDIDLSILGQTPPVYDQFEKDVRKEYRLVPGFMFRKKRKEILQKFLSSERLYFTDHFYERLEAQAKDNLARTVAAF